MNIIRWILFIPGAFITSIVVDILLKFIYNTVTFFWDSSGAFSKYGDGIESDGNFIIILLKYLIPAISYFIATTVGVYIAPNNRKFAVLILIVLNIIISILYLFTEYGSLWVSISSVIGTLLAYFNLKEKEVLS